MAVDQEVQHLGDTRCCRNHDRDLVHELDKRLDAVWRYDQYIANSEDKPNIQNFWRQVKVQDEENIAQLKYLLRQEIEQDCF